MLVEEDPYIDLKKPSLLKTVLSNNVTVYRAVSSEAFRSFIAVVNEFTDIQINKDISIDLL